jgi:aspartate kinase
LEIRQRVREVTINEGWALIKINGVPDQPGVAAQIFTKVAAAGVPVGLILQNASAERMTDVSITVRAEYAGAALEALEDTRGTIGAGSVEAVRGLATVEIVGTGILTDPTYVGRVFKTLADAGVNIQAIGTSEIRLTIVVTEEASRRAQQALHKAFQVGEGAVLV